MPGGCFGLTAAEVAGDPVRECGNARVPALASGCVLPSGQPLAVLDAQAELRGTAGARWVRAWLAEPHRSEVLTRVRVPREKWQVQGFRRLPPGTARASCAH